MKRILISLAFFCLLAGSAYFLIWSPVLWIKEIEVRPLASSMSVKEIVQENLDEKIWQVIPQKSFLLVPLEKIRKEILERFPEIKEVVISKKIPNLLIVEVSERQSIGIWCQTESTTTEPVIRQCFCLDKEGIIFRESPLISGSFILNIFNFKKEPAVLGEKVASPEMVDFILKTAQGLFLKIDNFEIISPEDLRARTSDGWQIYFNPTYSANRQINALKTVLKEKIKENANSLEYIDLRIDGRVYYK